MGGSSFSVHLLKSQIVSPPSKPPSCTSTTKWTRKFTSFSFLQSSNNRPGRLCAMILLRCLRNQRRNPRGSNSRCLKERVTWPQSPALRLLRQFGYVCYFLLLGSTVSRDQTTARDCLHSNENHSCLPPHPTHPHTLPIPPLPFFSPSLSPSALYLPPMQAWNWRWSARVGWLSCLWQLQIESCFRIWNTRWSGYWWNHVSL